MQALCNVRRRYALLRVCKAAIHERSNCLKLVSQCLGNSTVKTTLHPTEISWNELVD